MKKSKKSSCLLKNWFKKWWFAAETMFRFNFQVEAEAEVKDGESPSQPLQLPTSDQVNFKKFIWFIMLFKITVDYWQVQGNLLFEKLIVKELF